MVGKGDIFDNHLRVAAHTSNYRRISLRRRLERDNLTVISNLVSETLSIKPIVCTDVPNDITRPNRSKNRGLKILFIGSKGNASKKPVQRSENSKLLTNSSQIHQ